VVRECKLHSTGTRRRASYPDWVRESECDGERQSFWNGDHEHRHSDNEEFDEVFQVFHLPRLFLYDESGDWKVEDENHNSQQSYGRTCNNDLNHVRYMPVKPP